MNIKITGLTFLIFLAFFSACRPKKDKDANLTNTDPRLSIYRGSVTMVNDLVHTKLELQPDFRKREMKGVAHITLEPHFYPVDSLILDAVQMRIEKVAVLKYSGELNSGVVNPELKPLNYSYDSAKLRIALDKRYIREETYTIVIHYVAQPEKVITKGSHAITSRKGLYFINHDASEKDKPVQLWTQGETQAASCWFPTIDAPNQKSSLELSVEVPKKFKTVSNGLLMRSEELTDSTRTDYWKQDKPHAPYLFALVVGDFAEVKDKWRNKDVHYFVEPEYVAHAKLVFGNTPEMLTFFSDILGYDYPWDKFHQVVVRDFVSGAMENTGCVVHFDKLQHDAREHLDETYEDIIAHELFHHWFGDLLTCESWSNIPLNESFATYGEYLWNEHKYGRNEADYKLSDFHGNYMGESSYKSENLIRYHYLEQEEMFDAHSYQKGGSVLHMLRKYTGDEAFFKSLKLYLHRHQYKTVEISDLRKAFEEITGEDLNWFFDQWFLDKGHPELTINHTYSAAEGYRITVIQLNKRFKLPLDIDIHTSGGIKRQRIIISKDTQVIKLADADEKSFVQFDAENQLLAVKNEIKTSRQWKLQLTNAKLASHRLEAFEKLCEQPDLSKSTRLEYCKIMLEDSFWNNRLTALYEFNSKNFDNETLKPFAEEYKTAMMNEPVAAVRKAYVQFFSIIKDESTLKYMLNDSSYDVVKRSVFALGQLNRNAAYNFADQHRHNPHRKMQSIVFGIIGRYSGIDELDYFFEKIEKGNSQTIELAAGGLGSYIMNNQPQKTEEALARLEKLLSDQSNSKAGKTALESIHSYYYYQIFYMQMMMGWNKVYKNLYKDKIEEARKVYKRLDAMKGKA